MTKSIFDNPLFALYRPKEHGDPLITY
jgi:hypothetical protein